MKTTLAILVTGLILLATPFYALADGDRAHRSEGFSKYLNNRHQADGHRGERRDFRQHRPDHGKAHRAARHFRQHRPGYGEKHLVKRHFRQHRRHDDPRHYGHRLAHRHDHRHYVSAPVVIAPSRIVLRLGW